MDIVFLLHSLWRWVVLVMVVVVVGKALAGWLGKQPWQAIDDKLGMLFTTAFDVQLLLGLIVYAGAFMSLHAVRWYGQSVARLSMEHVAVMIVALVIAHVTRVRAKKGASALAQHRTTAIGTLIALLMVLAAVPTWGMSAL